MLGGPVRVDDAEQPQAAAAKLHGHADRGADHGQVKVGPEELQAADTDEVGDPLQVVAEVEMPEAGNDRQCGRQGRTLARLTYDALI